MMEHLQRENMLLAADNAGQLFECNQFDGARTIVWVLDYPECDWRPVKTTKTITKGCRIKVKQTSGFHKGATGIVEFIEPYNDDKVWVLRDGASKPCWFRLEELEVVE